MKSEYSSVGRILLFLFLSKYLKYKACPLEVLATFLVKKRKIEQQSGNIFYSSR